LYSSDDPVKSFVWNFGVVIWSLFSLSDPSPGYNNLCPLFWNIIPDSFLLYLDTSKEDFLTSLPPTCPNEIFSLLKWCFAADPRDRPRLTEVLTKLEAIWMSMTSK
jgi:hypothetical protein